MGIRGCIGVDSAMEGGKKMDIYPTWYEVFKANCVGCEREEVESCDPEAVCGHFEKELRAKLFGPEE